MFCFLELHIRIRYPTGFTEHFRTTEIFHLFTDMEITVYSNILQLKMVSKSSRIMGVLFVKIILSL